MYRIKINKSLEKNKLTPTELSDNSGVRINHISNILKELKKNDLITCLTENKKKGRIYCLTEKGNKVIKLLNERRNNYDKS